MMADTLFKPFPVPPIPLALNWSGGRADEPRIHIGSSDAGSVLGFGFDTPADRWARVLHLMPRYDKLDDEMGGVTMRGRMLEESIVREWARRHKPVELAFGPSLEEQPFVASDGWRTSRPDAIARLETGDVVYVEAKSTYDWWWDEETRDGWGPVGTDWVPKLYRCQAAWQLGVGWDPAVGHNPMRVDIAAFGMGDTEYREYSVPYGPVVTWLEEQVTAWMREYVWCEVPHPPGLPSSETLAHIYRAGGQRGSDRRGRDRQWRSPSAEEVEIAARLWRTRHTIALLERRKADLEGHLKVRIGDKWGIRGIASWGRSKDGTKLDKDRLRRERPDVYRQFCMPTEGGRKFRLLYRPDSTVTRAPSGERSTV